MTATPLLRDAAVSVRYSLRGSGPLSRRRSFRLPSSIRAASKRRDQNVPADREYYRVPARVLPTHAAPSCATPAVCSAQGQGRDCVRAAAGTARIPLACNIQHTKPMQQAVHIPGAPSTADLWLHHQDVDDAPVGLPVRRRISLICLYRRRLGLRWRPGAESMAACVNQVVLRSADPAYTASCLQHAFGLTPKRTASDLQPGVQVSRVEYVLAATVGPTSLHTLPFC